MKTLKVTKNEMTACKDLFEKIAAEPELMDQLLQKLGKDPAEIRAELTRGVGDFYSFYEGEVNAQTAAEKLEAAAAAMNPLQKYTYYANLMVAFSHMGGKVFGDEAWTKCLNDHRNILSAIELGLIEADDLHVAEGAEKMKDIIAQNIEAFSVLFVDDPDMTALQEACKDQDMETIQAMALNSRELAVDMAAAVYVLQESGELKSLPKGQCSAHDIAVMAASGLEIDAARKSGNLETAKKIIRKAAVAAVTLLVTAPVALLTGGGVAVGVFFIGGLFVETLGALFTLAKVAGLVGGAALLVFSSPMYKAAHSFVDALVAKGAKVLDTTVAAVKPLCEKLSGWVRSTVMPAVLPIWEKCRSFTCNKIIIPAVAFILKHKNTVLQTGAKLVDKAKALYEQATGKVSELYSKGSDVVQNIVDAAQNLAAEEAAVEDDVFGSEVDVNEIVEFELPLEEETEEETTDREITEELDF